VISSKNLQKGIGVNGGNLDYSYISRPSVLKLMRSIIAMVEDKASSFLWLLLLFFGCPLLCCGILSSNSNLFDLGPISPNDALPPKGDFTQVSLLSYLNNKGIGSAPGQANFDGSGFSYAAKQLPPGGLRLLGGVPYQFPRSAPKANDNIAALGQVIKLPPGNYRRAFLLVSSSWGSNNLLKVTVHYTDGSISSGSFYAPDWVLGPSGVVNSSHRYSSTDTQGPVHIYAVQIAMNRAKKASSLILPKTAQPNTGIPSLHVFALTLQ
jgi:hypothetical protein